MRVGIIGCGRMGRSHALAYQQVPTEIVGLTDGNPEAAATLSAELGGTATYGDHRELIDKARPECISICTPPNSHEEIAVYALKCRIAVLCEKPMAYDAAAARRMRDLALENETVLMPAFRHRFLPAIVALKEVIASGEIGEPVFFSNTFCGPKFAMEGTWFTEKAVAGGGCLLDTSSHSVDLFRFLIGEIVEQGAVMHRHMATTDVEDAAILCVKAASGAVGSIQSAFVAGIGTAFLDIMGTKGQAYYDYHRPDTLRYRLTGEEAWREQAVEKSTGVREEILHFIAVASNGHGLCCTADDGVRAMEIICSAYRS